MDETETINLQTVKSTIIDALVDEKFLTVEQDNTFISKYAVIVVKPSWFQHIFNKLFPDRGYDKNKLYYKVIKFVGSPPVKNDVDSITDVNELKTLLAEAENKEDYKLSEKILERIKLLEKK